MSYSLFIISLNSNDAYSACASAILLPGHGIVTVGETVEQACMLTTFLEEQAKKLFHASLLGKVPRGYAELLMMPPKASIESDT